MKDKWMNVGYEDDELKPYQEPSKDCTDPVRIGVCLHLLLFLCLLPPIVWPTEALFFTFLTTCVYMYLGRGTPDWCAVDL